MAASHEASTSAQPQSHKLLLPQDTLLEIAYQFAAGRTVTGITPLGNGNINDTFRVALDDSTAPYFVLQRINTDVFRQPHDVMQNMCRFTEHVQQRLAQHSLPEGRRWTTPRVIYTSEGHSHLQDSDGGFWRAISFIANAVTYDTVQSSQLAWEVGYGLGTFHQLLSDLPPEMMVDTLAGFHITPSYLAMYKKTRDNNSTTECPEVLFCTQFIEARCEHVSILESAKTRGELSVRMIHGDPKINNILFDADSQQAISLIDLDTVKPGLIHYDLGDCLRSGCNSLGEDATNWKDVTFDVEICERILQGYFVAAKNFLADLDYAYCYDAIWLISLELGLRFFTDYLAGDVYFKTRYAEHNLVRALVQFKLVESIEHQKGQILSIVARLRDSI